MVKDAGMNSSKKKQSVLCIVGARPNFMKIAPIMRALKKDDSGFDASLLHTGQHYDSAMKQSFFDQLAIPEPDIDLEVGSGSHAVQTANIMIRFESVLNDLNPDVVLVVGDVNSTIACSLVAAKKLIPVVHVEAGLRSRDRSMPEEINRVLTDQISSLLFTTEPEAEQNLLKEGIASDRIEFVGNVMIDTLLYNLPRAVPYSQTLGSEDKFGLVTLHRPSNVDDSSVLSKLIQSLILIQNRLPLVFPLHPRTEAQLRKFDLLEALESSGIRILPPQGYLQMLGLMKGASLVLTDSGGIQEETTALGVACITLRETTERPITLNEGTNVLVGTDPEAIEAAFVDAMSTESREHRIPRLWDGKAAERIVQKMREWSKSL